MKSQTSILSFLQKPQPKGADRNDAPPPGIDSPPSLPEVRGIDPPPEKSDPGGGSSIFSAVKHKFIKADPKQTPRDKGLIEPEEVLKVASVFASDRKDDVCGFKDYVPISEAPAARPVVPGFKRVQLESAKCLVQNDWSLSPESDKRVQVEQEPEPSSNGTNENAESTSKLLFWWQPTSKFEWLDPSRIQDANRRGPDDPLYDKKTLYIPPDALEKMSATQKQYWRFKSRYMDAVIFFKVGKFYELYEVDAEIGHKELNWKPTSSSIGKCSQVTVSESIIDDVVGKLVAQGYKVGRIEQLEMSDQDKASGSNLDPNEIVEARIYIPSTVTCIHASSSNNGKSPRQLRSSVWKNYTRYKDEAGRWKAKCKRCGSIYAADPSRNGTSTLDKHIKIRCKWKPPINLSQETSG